MPADHYAITFNMVTEKVTREKIPRKGYVWKSVNDWVHWKLYALFWKKKISLEMLQNNSIEFISLEMGSEVFNFVNKLYDCFYFSANSVRNKLVPFEGFLCSQIDLDISMMNALKQNTWSVNLREPAEKSDQLRVRSDNNHIYAIIGNFWNWSKTIIYLNSCRKSLASWDFVLLTNWSEEKIISYPRTKFQLP